MATISVVNITIKAYVALGETIPEQLKALNAIQKATQTNDYSEIMALAKIVKTKVEPGRRRVDDEVEAEGVQTDIEDELDDGDFDEVSDDDTSEPISETTGQDDDSFPANQYAAASEPLPQAEANSRVHRRR